MKLPSPLIFVDSRFKMQLYLPVHHGCQLQPLSWDLKSRVQRRRRSVAVHCIPCRHSYLSFQPPGRALGDYYFWWDLNEGTYQMPALDSTKDLVRHDWRLSFVAHAHAACSWESFQIHPLGTGLWRHTRELHLIKKKKRINETHSRRRLLTPLNPIWVIAV